MLFDRRGTYNGIGDDRHPEEAAGPRFARPEGRLRGRSKDARLQSSRIGILPASKRNPPAWGRKVKLRSNGGTLKGRRSGVALWRGGYWCSW